MPELTMPKDSSGKTPKWVLYGGAAVGLLALFVFMRGKQGGNGTTAAGTSINAALGSLQEEQLQTQGDLSKFAADTGSQLNVINAQTSGLETQVNDLAGSVAQGNAATGATLSGIETQINDVAAQTNSDFTDLTNQHLAAAATGTF